MDFVHDLDCDVSSVKRGRKHYTVTETNLIVKECFNFLKSEQLIREATVKELFSRNKKLKQLWDNFGLKALVIKLRTERSKLRKKN